MRRTPLSARLVASQKRSRPMPLGLTAPIPVTTTLRFNPEPLCLSLLAQYRLEVMFAANGSRPGLSLRHALAGLQAGVLGALVMLVFLMIGSRWDGRSIWAIPNLFATTFFRNDIYRNELVRSSWTGVALLVAIYGMLGILWGCVWRDGERKGARRWLTLYGALTGLAVYFLFFHFIWIRVNGLITLYGPNRQLIVGHVLWGMVLARSPRYARRIAERLTAPVSDASEVAAHTGEVINS